MLFQHATEVIPVRKAAVFGDLFDRLIRVAQEMAGAVEAIAQEHAHRGHSHLGAEEMIQIPDTHPGSPGGILRVDASREIGLEEVHCFCHADVEFLVRPRFRRQFSEIRRIPTAHSKI